MEPLAYCIQSPVAKVVCVCVGAWVGVGVCVGVGVGVGGWVGVGVGVVIHMYVNMMYSSWVWFSFPPAGSCVPALPIISGSGQ